MTLFIEKTGNYYSQQEVRDIMHKKDAEIERLKSLNASQSTTFCELHDEIERLRDEGYQILQAYQHLKRDRKEINQVFRLVSGYRVMVPIKDVVPTSNGLDVEIAW